MNRRISLDRIMNANLAELREHILRSRVRKRALENAADRSGINNAREDGEVEEGMEDILPTPTGRQTEPASEPTGNTGGEGSFVEPYLPNKRPNLHQHHAEVSREVGVPESSSQAVSGASNQPPATVSVKHGPNKYGQSGGNSRNSNAGLTPYNPYAQYNQGYNMYPTYPTGATYTHPPVPYFPPGGYPYHPGMMATPAHPAANIHYQQPPPIYYTLPTVNQSQATNKSRPATQETSGVKHDIVFDLTVPASCQFKDLSVSELISKFQEGTLPPHGYKIACIKILQAIGERGDDFESLEAHSITLETLKEAGIVPSYVSTQAHQETFVTSTPAAQIDRNFAANRVNALLLPNRNETDRSHDLTSFNSAVKKTLDQLSRCGVDTVVPLVDFNGYLQTSEAVVELSNLLELINQLDLSVFTNLQTVETTPNLNIVNKPCAFERNNELCLDVECVYIHRCDLNSAIRQDFDGLTNRLYMLYSNRALSLRRRLDEIVERTRVQGSDLSETLCNIRRLFRNSHAPGPNGAVGEAVVVGPNETNEGPTDSDRMEDLEPAESPAGDSVAIQAPPARDLIVFKDLFEFLCNTGVDQQGVFSHLLTPTSSSASSSTVTDLFKKFMAEVRETGSATETIETLNKLLPRASDNPILFYLYFSLVLFYKVPPSKSLIEVSFQTCRYDLPVHLLMYQAYPSMGDKALVLQLMMEAVSYKPQDPKLSSSAMLHGMVNFLAVLDATRANPVTFLGRYARMLVDKEPPTKKKLLSGDASEFPTELSLDSSFLAKNLKEEDFIFCWLVFIYYLAFQGLPPVFASAPFNSCLKPDLFLIQWHTVPKEIITANLPMVKLVFSELLRQHRILKGFGNKGLIAFLRNYISFANIHAPLVLVDIENVLRSMLGVFPSFGELYELEYTVLQMQNRTIPPTFWITTLPKANSPGLSNFYLSLNMQPSLLPTALSTVKTLQVSDGTPCYFSWILQSYHSLLLQPDTYHSKVPGLFKMALDSFSNPRIIERLRLDFLKCVQFVGGKNGFYDTLNELDGVLSGLPFYIPKLVSSIPQEGIIGATELSFPEKALTFVAIHSPSNDVLEELLLEGLGRFPSSFELTTRLQESREDDGDLYQAALTFIESYPTNPHAWKYILTQSQEDSELSASARELLAKNKAYLSRCPHLFSLSLFT